MPKKIPSPKSPLESESWPLSPKEDLKLNLRILEEVFRADTDNALPAFQALSRIAAEFWGTGKKPRRGRVSVPWWAVDALADGFCRYRDSARTLSPETLGVVYNLEAKGQGKQRKIAAHDRDIRDIRIATRIAAFKEQGIKIEAALQEVSNDTGLSTGQVRRIWEKRRKHALSSLRNLRKTRKTS